MKLLVDTNVVSEVRHPQGVTHVKEWFSTLVPQDTFLSAITFAEIARGIAQLGRVRADMMRIWSARLRTEFAARILAVDADVAEIWGETDALTRARGNPVPMADGLIAATARVHGLHVATRNVRHMLAAGAPAYDPWTGQVHEPTS